MSTQNAMEEEISSDEDMFSPKKNKEKPVAMPVAADQRPGSKEHLVNKFKKLLINAGIPPPPVPDFHVDHFLTLWSDNQSFLWNPNDQGEKSKENDQPDDLGKCLNVDRSCEEFELVGQQVCDRYILSETAVVTSTTNVKLTLSAKKRRKANGWGLSPRTRISYLTRRMTTFQKDNIASASSKATQILISRSEPKKNSKKPEIKGRRVLFLSPERSNKFQTPEQGKSRRLCRQLMNSSPPEKILTTRSSERRKCSRSLFSAKETSQQPKPPQHHQPLSTQHRQKMLWAVSNALKCVKIRMNDPDFKNFAALLFKATYEKWKTGGQATCNGDKKVSTSDAMLATAKSLVEGVTGRRMSPKSARKQTPIKPKRDENNPPSSAPSTAPSSAPLTPLGCLLRISNEADIFPLDPDEALAKKLDLGALTGEVKTPRKLSRRLVIEESPVKSCRKRKRPEEFDRAEACSSFESPRVLRNRTPAKVTPVKTSPSVKRPKLDPSTPLKSLTPSRPVRQSPRLMSRTPSKPDPIFRSPTPTNRTPLKPLAQNTPEKTSKDSACKRPVARVLSLIEESPSKGIPSVDVIQVGELSGVKAVRASPRILRNRTPSKAAVPGAEAAANKETVCGESLSLDVVRSLNVTGGASPGILRNTASLIAAAPGAGTGPCDESKRNQVISMDVSPQMLKDATPTKVTLKGEASISEEMDCFQNSSLGVVTSLDMEDGGPRVLRKKASSKVAVVPAGLEEECAGNGNSSVGMNECPNTTNIATARKLKNRTPSKVAAPEAEDGLNDESKCNPDTGVGSRCLRKTKDVSPRKLRNRAPSKQAVLGADPGATGEASGDCLCDERSPSKIDGVPLRIRRNKSSPTMASPGEEAALDDESVRNDSTSFPLVECETNDPSPPALRSKTPSKVTRGTPAGENSKKAKSPTSSKKCSPGVSYKKSPTSSKKDKPPKLIAETDRRRLDRRCSIDPPILTREKTPPILERILCDWASPIEELAMKRRRSSATPQKSRCSDGGGSCSKRLPLSLAASRRSAD